MTRPRSSASNAGALGRVSQGWLLLGWVSWRPTMLGSRFGRLVSRPSMGLAGHHAGFGAYTSAVALIGPASRSRRVKP